MDLKWKNVEEFKTFLAEVLNAGSNQFKLPRSVNNGVLSVIHELTEKPDTIVGPLKSLKEFAAEMELDMSTLIRYRNKGWFKTTKIAGRRYISFKESEEFKMAWYKLHPPQNTSTERMRVWRARPRLINFLTSGQNISTAINLLEEKKNI